MFSLVLPTFNERSNIGPLIERIEAVLNREPIDFEIILVDDNSPDETWKLALEIAKEDLVFRLSGGRVPAVWRLRLWRGGKRQRGRYWG